MRNRGVAPASDSSLGDSSPRQEGPADLRLVPPALAAWATAAVTLDAPAVWVTALALTCAAVAGVLLLGGATRGRHGRTEPSCPPLQPPPSGLRSPPPRPPDRVFSLWPRMSVAAVLLCVAASAASAALHGADLTRGPVPGLARQFARVTVELEVTADPRLTRPRVKGDRPAPSSVVIAADVLRVGAQGGSSGGAGTRVRTPVLVLVDVDRAAAGRTPWLSLLPSTRLVVHGGLAPASAGGGRVAALLRVGRDESPRVLGAPSTAQRLAGKLRGGLREATEGLPGDARALLPGLVVGDTSRVPPELHEAFEATDLVHLTAVSGANFTILLALLIGPPGTAHRSERRGLAPRLGIPLRATAVLGGALTLGFVIVCRPEPSVLRAAACGSVALLAIGTGRRRSLIPALATVVLLLVLYDPWLARSYGFLLSVLATGALLILAPRWSEALRRRRCPPRLAEALAAAGAAQAVCAPVVAVIASRVSLVAVPCNLLAEFAVAPATVLGFAALAAAPLAMPVAKAFAWCASWPAGWIADIARAGAALPGGGVDWPGGPSGGLLLAVVTLGVILVGRQVLKSAWAMGICVLLLVLVVMQPRPLTRVITGWPPPGWRMVMCDVGQGDALVLAVGAGAGVVVDAGPDPVLVDRCLRSLGITRVPLVLLTHFHADHVAGLPGVLRGREVGAIETTGFDEPPEQVRFVRGLAEARHITMTRAAAGEQRRTGRLAWQVLWPPPRPAPDPDGPNDASVTLLVRTAGLTLLLMGDLEPPAQRALLRSPGVAALPPVDVLKVAHHGSAYQDPVLLRRVAPRLALISCGENNQYGHPSARTVAELRAGGAVVLRTDRDGVLAVTGSGQDGSGQDGSGQGGSGPARSGAGEREGAGLGVVAGGS
ncbi:ComEC/Rec2 family competence protein [Streptomyces sp. NBC_00117]|uniref:ComEC/Rec2 family competence protein n=1 Tax=Streptomyces TaxID=1883 RepID=UPI002E270208|nr:MULTISPECIES: ComEC/Rec2 family competence protein [unclassified Streptomyces]